MKNECKVKIYNDGRIRTFFPHDWKVWEDKDRNIFYQDPNNSDMWCFIQLGALAPTAKSGPLPSARGFLEYCYRKELITKEAQVKDLSDRQALLEWVELTRHEGKKMLVYHFNVAFKNDDGCLQLAHFSAAIPEFLNSDPASVQLQDLVKQQSESVKFYEWGRS